MKIAGVAAAFPERRVTNDHVLDLIKENSSSFEGNLDRTLRKVGLTLNYIGIKERRWLGEKDHSFEYTEQAVQSAMKRAGVGKDDIDLLIFASVDKRVAEPGMSFFVAKALGMKCECFDITEGCGGWVRATRIAQSYLKTGEFQTILIVTAEYTAHENQALHLNYCLKDEADLDWAFSAYTVGEGSTATVMTADENDWTYDNRSYPEWCTHCLAPLWHEDAQTMQYGESSMSGKGMHKFVSEAKVMQELSFDLVQSMIVDNAIPIAEVDLFVPHTQTLTVWKDFQRNLKMEIPYTFLLPEYGNLVNNSMAAGIALAYDEKRLQRGQNVAGLMTAAGMSFTMYNFRF
ncbi:MAG: hypothetical protein MI808_14295 [Pseudomonadales bacterium]|nr:hypothetical protein [Pseudomonadales bacterium]